MNAVEEQRAATYRAEQAARAKARLERCKALAGNTVARAALTANWAPLTLVDAVIDVDDCLTDGCGPFGPQTN